MVPDTLPIRPPAALPLRCSVKLRLTVYIRTLTQPFPSSVLTGPEITSTISLCTILITFDGGETLFVSSDKRRAEGKVKSKIIVVRVVEKAFSRQRNKTGWTPAPRLRRRPVTDVTISTNIRTGVMVPSVLMNKAFNRLIVLVVGPETYVRRTFRIRLIRTRPIRSLRVRCWNSFGECRAATP